MESQQRTFPRGAEDHEETTDSRGGGVRLAPVPADSRHERGRAAGHAARRVRGHGELDRGRGRGVFGGTRCASI
jgi:hypothetical protein